MSKKKAVIVHTDFRVYWPARLRLLNAFLAERGYALTVVEIAGKGSPYDFSDAGCSSADGLHWVRLFDADLRTLSPREMSKHVYAALEALQPDVVLAGAIAFPSGATAVRWARSHHRPVIIMDNARQEDVPRARLTNWVKTRIYRNVDAVLIPAASHVNSFRRWGVARERMFFGVNVIDNDWFAAKAAEARSDTQGRDRFGLPRRYFLGVGRQVPKKNWVTLLAAYRQYRASEIHDPWDLVLVGDGPERRVLEAAVRRDAIHGVHFVSFLSRGDLCVFYAGAGALVLPSYYGETWGLVVNEAMASGLPVLVSDQCGCAEELVEDGRNGWRFPPDDVGALAELLSRTSGLPANELVRFGEASRTIVAKWPLTRFCTGAWEAIEFCQDSQRGFDSIPGMILLHVWQGRFRPT
jgi:glycosyltransferase involved in cell wall biosynthesis